MPLQVINGTATRRSAQMRSASNDKENFIFDANFKVEVFHQRVEDDESINVVGWETSHTLHLDEEGNETMPESTTNGSTTNDIWADIAIVESDDEVTA